ncbi:hypothetical protein [Pulveribacter suum]|nr:hypothetical protein [Pulveribacter suum]
MSGHALAQDSLADHAATALAEQGGAHGPGAAGKIVTLRSEEAPLFTDAPARPSMEGAHYSDVTGWLTPDKPSRMGLTLGLLSARPFASAASSPLAYDLGVRLRSRLEQRVHLDVHAWARTPQQFAAHDAQGMIWSREPASVGTRVEVQWKASRTGGVVPEFGAIGVQLQGDAKLLLRARRGGPMVYYRAKF